MSEVLKAEDNLYLALSLKRRGEKENGRTDIPVCSSFGLECKPSGLLIR